ncbi:AMP-dependent synthetase/ligase [Amycolatopsis suaedae]|uniref:Acyl-CoA synthetase n=1 Tax=Amycolatopsis suaedae TaxID=2510978 RepID=A0A4Q7IZX5_9PSEU|nr:AMP-dependent synthetase/ligase [Amycolatopsis suaedae]RZQ60067.1 long-chain fatty acid--CoA ligase [Amycolatopsis suaedae]
MSDPKSLAEQVDGQTLPKLVRRNAETYGDQPALSSLDDPDQPTLNWAEYRREIAALARGLADLGLARGDRMLIMAPNRPEHMIVDMGATHLAALPCTAYATLSPDQVRYVARHSAAPVVVLGGEAELARWRPVLDDLPALRRIVMLDADALPEGDERFVSYADVRARGAELHAADRSVFEDMVSAIEPDDPLSMIYTSGTTGEPKAVVLSHRNAIWQGLAVHGLHETDLHGKTIAYLPLAHIAERELSLYIPTIYAGHVHTLADPTQIVGALGRVRPDGLFGVPRVWEKMVAGLKNMLASAPEENRNALLAAQDVTLQGYKLRNAGKPVPADLAERIEQADAKVLAPVRAMLGLDNLKVPSSGAAALPVEVLYFIAGLGIEIQEVWGLSETTGAATSNCAKAFRAGSVGKALPGVEIRTGEDGELFVRGPIVFLGYLQADGTIEPAVDADGWFATGDIGAVDDDGYVTITDRKKELIITSGGKNIAPTRIESLLKEHPLIGQAVAIGDNRPYVTALIVLDDEIAPGWAAAQGIEIGEVAELAEHPAVRAEIDRAVESANERLARVEQIKKYHLLPKTWTPETGELTPTLKLKRRVITDRYAPHIEGLYEATAPA